MSGNTKKEFGKTKAGLIICAVLVIALAGSTAWFFIETGNLQTQVNRLQGDKSALQNQVDILQTDKSNLQNQISTLELEKAELEIQVSSLQTEKNDLQNDVASANTQIENLNSQISSLNTQISNLETQIDSLELEIEILKVGPKQYVVNELEENFGFDVTFVYNGDNETLTFGTENSAVVVMLTDEHVSNFIFTETHEQQFSEGKIALKTVYPNAEVFLVFILEDLDENGTPDPGTSGYYEVSGGGYGGRTQTAFPDEYWTDAEQYVGQ